MTATRSSGDLRHDGQALRGHELAMAEQALGLSSCSSRSAWTASSTPSGNTIDPAHHLYEPGNKYENAILDYYKSPRPARSASLLAEAGEDTVRPGRLGPRGQADEGRLLRQRMAHRAGRPRAQGSPPRGQSIDDRPSTGRRPRPGAGAATTPGSSSTSRAASRRASSSPRTTRKSARP